MLGEKMLRDNWDILGDLAQWRRLDAHDFEPIIEVFAKPPLVDRAFRSGSEFRCRAHGSDVFKDRLFV